MLLHWSLKFVPDIVLPTILVDNNDTECCFPNEELTVIGYGDTDIRDQVSTSSNILMETIVYSQSNLECESSSGIVESEWGPVMTSLKGGITDNMICAYSEGSDACQVRLLVCFNCIC